MSKSKYDVFLGKLAEIESLNQVMGILSWDQETMMPKGALSSRALQNETLSGIIHEAFTSEKLGALAHEAENEYKKSGGNGNDPFIAANFREFWRQYKRTTKVPKEIIQEITRTQTEGHAAWIEARKKSDYSLFLPYLKNLVKLRKEEALAIDATRDPYDTQIEKYEVGVTSGEITQLFSGLKKELLGLIKEIAASKYKPNTKILHGDFPQAKQKIFGKEISKALGFDRKRGRLDRSVHPFCGGGGPQDVRITTRFNEDNFSESLFAVIHETGHALYEQGLDPKRIYEPAGGARSMGVHESQSLLWERHVGMSREFWQYYFPKTKKLFPKELKKTALKDFYFALNEVRPSLVRVDADEVTYSLHIILRFEIETGLFKDNMDAEELPDLWNAKTKEYLGLKVPNDGLGILQDVHWSSGLFGYFPTYTLGAIYAAQIFRAIEKTIPKLREDFKKGKFSRLKNWLNENIHQKGSLYETDTLIQKATGEKLKVDHYLDYLRTKYTELYRL